MNLENLEKISKKEPSYRQKQIQQAVFKQFISEWDEMTNIPNNLKEELKKDCLLEIEGEIFPSADGKTFKALLSFSDGAKIETVLMRNKDNRNSLCVSSQVGCAGGCAFCATGKMGFNRNLTSEEIISQFLFFARYLKKNFGDQEKITNVIFMGMGEPFLNYDQVMTAVQILNKEEFIGLGARNISISTVGIIVGIKKFTEEKEQINLAISLHAPNDELRSKLIPTNKENKIKELLGVVDEYIVKKSRKVMFEYLLIENVNDSARHAKELAGLMKKPLYMVNLIKYNTTGDFRASSENRVNKFKKILKKEGVNVTVRKSFGSDINAGCGQLANKN